MSESASKTTAVASQNDKGKDKGKGKGKPAPVYKPQPVTENILTALFFGSVYFILTRFGRQDLTVFGGALLGTTVAVFLVKYMSSFIGRVINSILPWKPLSKRVNNDKFCEQVWQLVVHISLSLVDWKALEGEPWYEDVSTVWVPDPLEQVHKPFLRFIMMLQLGVWVYTLIIHRWVDTPRRKDFIVMYIHHVATIWLVAIGCANGFHRISVVILAVHDTSDILIDMLKIVNLLGVDGAKGLFLVEITFVSNLIVWIYFRLWIFPTRIMRSVYIDFHALVKPLDKPYPGEPWKDLPGCLEVNCYWQGVTLLTLLQCLHVLWTYILLRIAYKLLAGHEGHKVGAEEYEGASDSEVERRLKAE